MGQSVSIRGITTRYLLIILLIALLGVALLAWLSGQAVHRDALRHQQFESSVLQRQFSELIGFYHGITAELSRQTEVGDMLLFGEDERAQVWAKGVQRLLPESIGVALIDADGNVMGEPLRLNLGTQCLHDLHNLFSGRKAGMPPVHRAVPELAHFDVVHEVERDGERLGLLFVSFSLDVIQHRVERLHESGQVILIEDAAGEAIAYAGSGGPLEHLGQEHSRMPIDGTDWRLHYMAEEGGVNAIFIYTLAAAGLILIATVAVMLMLSLRLVGLFKHDLVILKMQLDGIHSGEGRERIEARTSLAETAAIMDEVGGLMRGIEQARDRLKELSLKDELSGLSNRRGFMESLEQSLELSERGVKGLLLLLDLDHFKAVNDGYGHAAGDEVIKALAMALKERSRSSDVVARLGGDEFAVILNVTTSAEGVEQWYGDLALRFRQLQAKVLPNLPADELCGISAGWAPIDKQQYANTDQQLDAADQALYRAKSQGRGRIVA